MGATASRSSPKGKKTTCRVTISEYSKLVRVPMLHHQILDTIFFSGLSWDVTVKPMRFDDEGLAQYINVAVGVGCESKYRPDLVLEGIDISIEVLDETGKSTVFHKESSETLQASRRLILFLNRRELEASSCLRNDSFTVRCTMSKRQATKWYRCLFPQPDKKLAAALEPPQVAMAGSHMLTVASFSKLKAALQNGECTYSTHFAVGGCRWFFQFSPRGIFGLVRASNHMTPTTAEFSFELEGGGVVNFKSEKMTHTFDYSNYSRYLYRCRLEPSTLAMHDRLIVRCRIAVIIAEMPSLPPAAEKPSLPLAAIQTTTIHGTESILTPLLSAMYD